MELDLKLCRFESAPWGFRLIGGSDFELPLTVVKVAEESLAEKAGMQVGDVILKVNDEPTAELSHTQMQKLISSCGNNFLLTVYREERQEENGDTEVEVVSASEIHKMEEQCQQEVIQSTQAVTSETTEIHEAQNVEEVTQEEISEVSKTVEEITSNDAEEALTNENATKSAVCTSSEVFRTIKEESTMTATEMEKEKRKWTTFLQKPNRPIPKTKLEQEQEIKRQQYRVQIVKQQKPKVAPDRIPTPPPEIPEEPEPEPEQITKIEEEPCEPPTDSEVPNLEPVQEETLPAVEEADQTENRTENVETPSQNETEPQEIAVPEPEQPQKTEEELMFEKQLVDIQKQLLALSSLPSTIQATLDAVTRQLSGLMPNLQLDLPVVATSDKNSGSCTKEEDVTNDESKDENMNEVKSESTEEVINVVQTAGTTEEVTMSESYEEQTIEEHMSEVKEEHAYQQSIQETIVQEEHFEQQFSAEEHQSKSQKELVMLELEHKQRLIKERASKRPPRAFGPLTPQERPLVLPGGRKWRRPKDAYNDELIADILSSQAELIVGSTLGSTCESTNVSTDPRVNFLKYKKPEKHIDLEKSEVYKVIHELDHSPKRGIEFRPEKVVAEADVRSCVTPVP
ncbi:titin isoform X2 [Hermetia illucens]|uniref:titin isoform X2 n=1 Tax=Hermetia illucens TaxID=343691 RepID=UPI0018CC53BA|nr:titin isoform X2 [Hermetia illucens]